MSATLWITGVAGFTGRHLLRFFESVADRPRIVGVDVTAGLLPPMDALHLIDLTDPEAVAAAARQDPPTWVIHLAGLMPPAEPSAMWQANVGGTVGLLRGLRVAGCDRARVVSVGSAAEYLLSKPTAITESDDCGGSTVYGRTKWTQSTLALALGLQLGLPVMVVRPFNLIGPGLPRKFVAAELCAQFAQSGDAPIRVGNTASQRDFIDVRDAVAAYWLVAQRGWPGQIYNVCSGAPAGIGDLIALMRELTGRQREIEVDADRLRGADPGCIFGDNHRLREATGWEPTIPLRQSLQDMMATMR